MIELRYEDQNLAVIAASADRPIHPVLVGDRAKACLDPFHIGFSGQIEHDPRKEPVGFRVVELMGFEDIAAMREKLRRHARDDAGLVRTG